MQVSFPESAIELDISFEIHDFNYCSFVYCTFPPDSYFFFFYRVYTDNLKDILKNQMTPSLFLISMF